MLLRLPESIIHYILTYMSLREAARISHTCTLFKQLAPHLDQGLVNSHNLSYALQHGLTVAADRLNVIVPIQLLPQTFSSKLYKIHFCCDHTIGDVNPLISFPPYLRDIIMRCLTCPLDPLLTLSRLHRLILVDRHITSNDHRIIKQLTLPILGLHNCIGSFPDNFRFPPLKILKLHGVTLNVTSLPHTLIRLTLTLIKGSLNLEQIGQCVRLRYLTLINRNADFNVDCLQTLRKLVEIELFGFKLTTLKFLQSDRLISVILRKCRGLQSIQHLPKSVRLFKFGNAQFVSDLHLLGETRLRHVELLHGDLVALPRVQTLRWEHSVIPTDLACLRRCRLRKLMMGHVSITTLDPVGLQNKLVTLSLIRCGVRDVTTLSQLKLLKSLELDFNPITDIAPIHGLAQLEELSLVKCPITDITPLGALINLTSLKLDWPQNGAASTLRELTQLLMMHVRGINSAALIELVELAGVTGLKSLQHLRVVQCHDVTLDMIRGLAERSSLREIIFHDCPLLCEDEKRLCKITMLSRIQYHWTE